MITLLVTALVVLFGLYLLFPKRPKGNYPPGPTPLPIIGNIVQIDSLAEHTFDAFTKLSEKYGPIFSLKFASLPAIVLNDHKLIRAAFNEHQFSGRPDNRAFNFSAGGKFGVLCADGQTWTEQRRFTLRHLRDFGFGTKNMESIILDEVTELLDTFKTSEGQPIEVKRQFSLAILNSLWIIVTGTRFQQNDPKLTAILSDFFKQIDEVSNNGFLSFIPAIADWFPEWSGWNNLVRATEKTTKLFESVVKEHLDTKVDDSPPRDFIDSHLDEINRTGDKTSSFYKDSGHKQLIAIIGDLFAAGAETTSTTLNWSVLYLSKYPEVRIKFQTEIDTVIGKNRMPSLEDKQKMPYTEALMYEILRKSSIVSLGLFHNAMSDVKFQGYDIPKDTYIVPNLYYAHHNPSVWGDPEEFRPERFLSVDKTTGETIAIKHEALMPFSTGKRQCIGETLAKDEFFLFLTSLYQKYDIEFAEQSKNVTIKPKKTFLLSPEEYSVVMKVRN